MLLEVIAETVEDAREAEQGGAGRIELVRDLGRGGLTPSLRLVAAVVRAVEIPVRVMLRESEPFALVDPGVLARLHAAARDVAACGAAGFVVGFLEGGMPHVAAVREVLGALAGPATFHRAFDDADRRLDALAAIAGEPRVDRVLTSGGAGPWRTRLAGLMALRCVGPAHLTILPGGGIDDEALRQLAAEGFPEAHIGRAARVPPELHGRVRAHRVAQLVALAT